MVENNVTDITWSAIARKHNVKGRNRGQIVKVFARQSGFDVAALEGCPERERTPRPRAQKRKMLSGVSAPCLPTVDKIKELNDTLVASGEILLGQPCAPYTLTRCFIKDGKLEQEDVEVYGRKIPLLSLRQKLLISQEKFMRLETNEQLQQKSRHEIITQLDKLCEHFDPTLPTEDLRESLKHLQHKRHLLLWHDHATLVGYGYLLLTVSVVYDPAIFLTREEYAEKTGKDIPNLQQCIEEPHIHMLAVGSSSISDQLALIADRVDCLQDLSTNLHTSGGIEVINCLRFFTGDKPAQSFE